MNIMHPLYSTDFFNANGHGIFEDIYTSTEIKEIINIIEQNEKENSNFRKSEELFAIRQVLNEIPSLKKLIFNRNLLEMVQQVGGNDYFIIKSIYFDKPETSNWVVPYHQDLTISVKKKNITEGYTNWTSKNNQIAVQPPLAVLENIFTIRIHLDNTTYQNGAVKVIPQSHKKAVIPLHHVKINKEDEFICEVPRGGIMLMKPLTLHASTRTTNHQRRRVIHIEFSNFILENNLEWAEYSSLS